MSNNGKLALTEKGLRALIDAESEIAALEVHVLTLCLEKPRTMLELVQLITQTESNRALKFLDPKYIASASARLLRHNLVRYESDVPLIQRATLDDHKRVALAAEKRSKSHG